MKILLINSPIRLDARPNCIPSGLAYMAGLLREHGFETEIYDINALRPDNHEIIAALEKKQWDVVGLSGLVTTYAFQRWLIPQLKIINPQATVVSGGGLATSNSALLFAKTPVDITVIGEGEQTMLELCVALSNGGKPDDIKGIWYRRNGRIIQNEIHPNIVDLDRIPFPAWDLLPMEIYLRNPVWGDQSNNSSGFREDVHIQRSMNIISSRGCPYACNYCYHLFGRSDFRFRSARNVVAEIEILVDRYQVDFIAFVDDNMMASERRLLEFCQLVVQKQLPITWGCHGRVTSAKPEILNQMAQAGCVWIGFGIESGSQKILDLMNKRASVQQGRQAVTETRKAGIFANTTFIFGYPGETLESIQETIDFKRELDIQCGSFFATPYPGTSLYQQAAGSIRDEEAFIESLGNATEFSVNLTHFEDETLFRLKHCMDNNIDVIQ